MGEIQNKELSKVDGQDEVDEERRGRRKESMREREKGPRNRDRDRIQDQGYQGEEQVGENYGGENMEEGITTMERKKARN